jgi:hypothetical protein
MEQFLRTANDALGGSFDVHEIFDPCDILLAELKTKLGHIIGLAGKKDG